MYLIALKSNSQHDWWQTGQGEFKLLISPILPDTLEEFVLKWCLNSLQMKGKTVIAQKMEWDSWWKG